MSIEDVLDSSYSPEEPEERLDVTGGPGIPDEELPEPTSDSWKKEYVKRGAGIGAAITALYTGYELGTIAGEMTVEDFLDSVNPSVEEVLNGVAETGSEAVMLYGQDAAAYSTELAQSIF